ncbi:MAG: dynamin family protein [bacterium]
MMMDTEFATEAGGAAKPRLALMGEFSSGKSTLSNLLLGSQILPTQVTATRLPPVYVTYGEPSAYAIGHDGTQCDVDLADLSEVSPEQYRSLHVAMICDTLELFDLVDMPGISDPNMPADTWDSIVSACDHVIWCTHATQAWRQSEAAMWERMRETSNGAALLVITQFDKLQNARDRDRVLHRVKGETEGKFTAVYPVSLIDALKAEDDMDMWKASGANDFMEHLVEIVLSPVPPARMTEPAPYEADDLASYAALMPDHDVDLIEISAPECDPDEADLDNSDDTNFQTCATAAPRVEPRRVRAKSPDRATPRPTNAPDWVSMLEIGAP